MTYLKMPLQLQSAVAKKLQRCSYQESIAPVSYTHLTMPTNSLV